MKRQCEIEKRLLAQTQTYYIVGSGEDGFAINIKLSGREWLQIIASWGKGWDHVSVKICNENGGRVPTWVEMCAVKDLFWRPLEWAVQYHPADEDYINCHPNVLHLWKPQRGEIKRPPKILV